MSHATAAPALAPEIISALSSAARPLFMANGLTEVEISGLLISSTNSNPLHQLPERLTTYAGNFFPLEMGGAETTAQLLAESKCTDLSGGIVAQFPVTSSDTKVRRIVEWFNFDHDASDDEVLAAYKEPGCEGPSYELGFRMAIRYPDVQRKRLLVVRPEPLWQDRDRRHRALILHEDSGDRFVSAYYVVPRSSGWHRLCWFARFRRFE